MSETIHPLFDGRGYYRLATRCSLWRDGGDGSIREFFLARAQQEQRRRGLSPDALLSAIDWGYDDATNAEIGKFMAARKLQLEKPSEYSLDMAAGVGEEPKSGRQPPSLLIADPIGSPLRVTRDPDTLFTGVGADPLKSIEVFEMDVVNLSPERRAVALILDRHLVALLNDRLGRHSEADDSHVIETIRLALKHKTLAASEDEAACRRAFRVSTALALAPGLERVTTSGGRFACTIGLPVACPGLDFGTWIVVCVSPS